MYSTFTSCAEKESKITLQAKNIGLSKYTVFHDKKKENINASCT